MSVSTNQITAAAATYFFFRKFSSITHGMVDGDIASLLTRVSVTDVNYEDHMYVNISGVNYKRPILYVVSNDHERNETRSVMYVFCAAIKSNLHWLGGVI